MENGIDAIVRLIRAGKQAYARKWNFLGIFAFVFLVSVLILARLDLLPDASPASPAPAAAVAITTTVATRPVSELPLKIEISAINLQAIIANPVTTEIEGLDQALLKGAVRYPTSAKLGEDGNVVLFGHSSYLPVVKNQAYKTFNGIQKLVVGDVIAVSSSDIVYTYRVRSVTKESAASDAGIPLAVSGRVLTLSTCDSFGAKTDRFVVVADFAESHAISS